MLGLILKLQRNSCWWRTVGFQHWSWYTWAFLVSWTLTLGVLLCRCGFHVLFLFDSHKHCLCIRPWFLLVFICFLLTGPFSIIFLGHVVLWFLLFFYLKLQLCRVRNIPVTHVYVHIVNLNHFHLLCHIATPLACAYILPLLIKIPPTHPWL